MPRSYRLSFDDNLPRNNDLLSREFDRCFNKLLVSSSFSRNTTDAYVDGTNRKINNEVPNDVIPVDSLNTITCILSHLGVLVSDD